MRSIARFAVASMLAAGAAWLPTGTAFACSCAFPGYPELIGTSDVAVIGTVLAAAEPVAGDESGLSGDAFALARYEIEVSHSKSEVSSPMTLHAVAGDGGSCGITLGPGEEWLVLAMVENGVPTTSLCSGSTQTEHLDDETRALITEALTVTPDSAEPTPAGIELPMPLLLALGAVAAVGAVSLLAFRREGR